MKIEAQPLPRDLAEKDFARTFEEMAHTFGWRLAHFRNSLNARGHHQTAVGADGKGWPDYYAVHPASGDSFAAELKTRYNKATPEQAAWGEWLRLTGLEWFLWFPPDWPAIVNRLAYPTPAVTKACATAAAAYDEFLTDFAQGIDTGGNVCA